MYKVNGPDLTGPQYAFVVNTKTFDICISRSGHGKILRNTQWDKGECEGGWIFEDQNKITFYSGTLGEVSRKEEVEAAICNFYKRYFKVSS